MKKSIYFTILILCINSIITTAQVNNNLNNLIAPTAANVNLLPGTSNSLDLGSVVSSWKDLHLTNGIFHNGVKVLSFPNVTNTFLGPFAGVSNTTGTGNTFVGHNAGAVSVTANDNSFFGAFAGDANTTGAMNSFFGKDAGTANTTGVNNSFFGLKTGELNTTGNNNSIIGAHAGRFNTTGSGNVFIGVQAGFQNSTASDNSFVGNNAGYSNTTGTSNAFFGKNSGGYNTTSSNNSFFGAYAGDTNNAGLSNSFFGSNAGGTNTTASYNSFFGAFAGDVNTTGTRNCFFGTDAGGVNISGSDNSFFGRFAGSNNKGGSNSYFGRNAGSANTTGSTTTCIGFMANVSSGTLTNATTLGANSTVNASNKVRLGASTVTVVEGQVAYSFPSDGRFKTNIREDVPGLEFISKLRPVSYHFETQKFDEFLNQNNPEFKENMNPADYEKSTAVKQSGFIAQEVEQAMKETGYDFNGVHHPESETDNYSMSYELMVVPLVKAVQELAGEKEDLKSQIRNQQSEIETLKAEMAEIRKSLTENSSKPSTTFKLQGETISNQLGNAVPNPTGSTTTIHYQVGKAFHQAEIFVTDNKGASILRSALTEQKGTIILDVSSLSQGTYHYSLMIDGVKTETKHFSVIK